MGKKTVVEATEFLPCLNIVGRVRRACRLQASKDTESSGMKQRRRSLAELVWEGTGPLRYIESSELENALAASDELLCHCERTPTPQRQFFCIFWSCRRSCSARPWGCRLLRTQVVGWHLSPYPGTQRARLRRHLARAAGSSRRLRRSRGPACRPTEARTL